MFGWHSRFYGYGFCYVFTLAYQQQNPFNNSMHLHQDYAFVIKGAVDVGGVCVAFHEDMENPCCVHIRHEGSSTDCPAQKPRLFSPSGFPEKQLRSLLHDRKMARESMHDADTPGDADGRDSESEDDFVDDDRCFDDDESIALYLSLIHI